MPFSVIPA